MAARNRAIRKFQIKPTNNAEIASVARATASILDRIGLSSIEKAAHEFSYGVLCLRAAVCQAGSGKV
jgi:hypothetical protein